MFRRESAGKNFHQLLLGHRGSRPVRSADALVGIFSFRARTSFPVPPVTQSRKPRLQCPPGPALGARCARKGRSRFPLPRPCRGTAAPHPPRPGRERPAGGGLGSPPAHVPSPGQEEEEKAREVPAERLRAGSREPSSAARPRRGRGKGSRGGRRTMIT